MYNPVVEIWKMWGEREIGKQLNAGRGEGRGKVVFIRYLCYNGELGGGIGNKTALSGRREEGL